MNEGQELPQGWVLTKLEEVLTRITNGYALPQNNEAFEQSLPITRIETISNGTIDLEKVKYVDTPAEDKVEQYKLRKGDILFSHINSDKHLGKTAFFDISDITLIHGINLLLMRFTDAVASKYAHYLFNHYRAAGEFIKIAQRAVNQSSINQRKLNQLAFPLPPLPEQRRIVAKLEELFSRLDAGVAAVRRTQALLKRYRQSVLHAAVTGELTRAWREVHPAPTETGEALLTRIRAERRAQWEAAHSAKRGGQLPLNDAWKSKYVEPEAPDTSELPELPTGWVWASLDEVMTGILAGKNFSCNETPPQDDEYGLVKISAVTWGKYNPRASKTITDPDKINLDYLIKDGDFLFSRANTVELVGACVIVENATHNLLLSDKVLRFDFVPSVEKEMVQYALRSQTGRNQIEDFASGNQLSMRNISQDKIYRIAVPLPPLDEQAEIVAEVERRLTVLDVLSQTLTAELKRAERLRQSLLHRAFTGRLVPQDATDEPAAALLARLQAETAAAPAAPAKGKAGRGRKANAAKEQLSIEL